jgi:hypothetical protein
MTGHEIPYAREQRERWLRPDAERWVRPDLARYLAPGSPDAGVYAPLDRKYSPSQPRVPAGSGRESGQWTSGQGGSAPALPSLLDSLFQITPGETDNSELVQLAGDERALGINPDELINRHIMNDHIGKTDEELIARIQQRQFRGLFHSTGMDRNGSFDSVESARDLIARTIESNSEAAKQVASGQQRGSFLTTRFGYRTGKEAYLDQETSQIRMRTTYEVGVSIVHDARGNTGYRVLTAYPRNYNPRIGR